MQKMKKKNWKPVSLFFDSTGPNLAQTLPQRPNPLHLCLTIQLMSMTCVAVQYE